ncbi:MAG TPA: hypothetical protein VFW23_06025 [Tepidisphaeraceae bacterium]|nr:hypothetical protein [Tepidisphaeraceae bacterium]
MKKRRFLSRAIVISVACCVSCKSSLQGDGRGDPPIKQVSPPESRDEERTITIDWDSQLNESPSWLPQQNKSPSSDRTVNLKTLVNVRARVTQRTWPIFDVGGVGGIRSRTGTFCLLDGQHIPQHQRTSQVILTTTLEGLTRVFLKEGKIYTMIFTPDGQLYDVIDEKGVSGLNDLEKW